MNGIRSSKVIDIHAANFGDNCRETCPLGHVCVPQKGDTFEVYIERVNKAAEEVQ